MTLLLVLLFRLYLLNGVHDLFFLVFWWPVFIISILADLIQLTDTYVENKKRQDIMYHSGDKSDVD